MRDLYVSLNIYGGVAIMLSCYDARSSYDVDTFITSADDHEAFWDIVKQTAQENQLPETFLQESLATIINKDFRKNETALFQKLSHLTINLPTARQLLAMKLFSARLDEGSKDLLDAVLLCKEIGIRSRAEMNEILREYVREEAIRKQNRTPRRHNSIYKFMDEVVKELRQCN